MDRKYVTLDDVAGKLRYTNMTPEIDLHKIQIYHRNINRPGFQLTGFFEYFDQERIQIIGRAENEYLKGFTKEENAAKMEKLFSYNIPAMVYCRGIMPESYVIELATKYGVAVLWTEDTTARVILDILTWIDSQLAPKTTMHGVLVDVYGEGILLTGEAGMGKSETALELIKRGHRLVADDLVEITKVSDMKLVGNAPSITKHMIELRGIGIVDISALYGIESVKEEQSIDMIIHLTEWTEEQPLDRMGLEEDYEEVLGVKLLKYNVPVRPGRNMAIIVETAAVNTRQKQMGYDAAKEIEDRIARKISQKNSTRENRK